MGSEFCRCGIAVLAFALVGLTHADDDPMKDPRTREILRAMEYSSTWYHPDLFGEFNGMQYYARHRYAQALESFKIGAYFSDKPSQMAIGLMYLNGEGVEKDPVAAYAWFDLAAERDYLGYAATRDRIKATLTPEQLANAIQLRDTLAEHYADAVAKPRMARELARGLSQETGTRTGADINLTLAPWGRSGEPDRLLFGWTGKTLWDHDGWIAKQYFAARDRLFKATVTVGAIEAVDADKQAAPASDSAATDTSANKPVQH